MEYVEIGARRDAYNVEDIIRSTLTVGELIEILEGFDESSPVVLSHDGGYTYGALHEGRITAEETDAELDEDYEEEEEEVKADDLFNDSWDNDKKATKLKEYIVDHDDSLPEDEECLHCNDDDFKCDDDFGKHKNSYDVDEAYSFKGLNDVFRGNTLAESLQVKRSAHNKKK